MKEELKEQIERLHNDLQFMEWLELITDQEGGEKNLAEIYMLQDSQFAESEPEN